MFSGIVECQAAVHELHQRPGVLVLTLKRPEQFDDIKSGDSIAVNGVCLTVETLDAASMSFALGEETLQVTSWNPLFLQQRSLNLERSMRWGDRLHGHMVAGHVDAMGVVQAREEIGEGLKLTIGFPDNLKSFLWTKGSVAVNGVSLTINQLVDLSFTVGLIPETLKRTNLNELQVGDKVTLEVDMVARALQSWILQRQEVQP